MKIALITGSCGLVGSESSIFFSKKGFKIIGIDNNYRKFFFGKDGDISWIKNKLKRNLKNYFHFNIDIRNYKTLEKLFKKSSKNGGTVLFWCLERSYFWCFFVACWINFDFFEVKIRSQPESDWSDQKC